MNRSNGMKQEWFDTGTGESRSRARQLRKFGYQVISSSMGNQVTDVGLIRRTMLTILNDDGNIPN